MASTGSTLFCPEGRLDHDYVSGHPDYGIYIGQCKPCDALVTDVVAERNAIGYEGTNASGNLIITKSRWSHNRVGLTPNSQKMERLAPQRDVVIAGNTITYINEIQAPSTAGGAFGFGIAIAGRSHDIVTKNLVTGNVAAGIAVTDLNDFAPTNNEITANRVIGNGTDLAYFAASGGVSTAKGNCFAGNVFTSSFPRSIETTMGCTTSTAKAPSTGSVVRSLPSLPAQPPGLDYTKVVPPSPQPTMANAATAPAVPADSPLTTVDGVARIDLRAKVDWTGQVGQADLIVTYRDGSPTKRSTVFWSSSTVLVTLDGLELGGPRVS